jgi:hypothetical protein
VPFVTDAVLRKAVVSANQHAGSPLPAHWEDILPTANRRAYNHLESLFLGRGKTSAQFAAWGASSTTHGYDWNLRYGVVYAFLEASKTDPERMRDFREELKELDEEFAKTALVTAGELVPGGRITYGDMDAADDRFLLDEPDGTGDYSTDDGTRL